MNTAAIAHGQAVRQALLAVARRSWEQRLPLPTYARMAAALGCQPAALTRHLRRLQAEGALTLERDGRRLRVGAVRG